MITATDVETFWHDGVVCLRGVLDPTRLNALHGPVDAARTADLSELAGDTSKSFVGGVDHWREQPALRAFACESALPAIVAALLRTEHVYLYEDSILVKEPGAALPTLWHQDLGYFHVDGTQVCTTWCPLDVVDESSGAMQFVQGSHRWPSVYRPNLFVDPTPIPGTEGDVVPDIDPTEHEVLTFALGPGDITVHHARTLHAAGPNLSSRRRRAISVRYCGDDARMHFRTGAPRKPEQQGLAEGSPLGGATHPLVYPSTA